MSSGTPFPIDPDLTALAISYVNGQMIADQVLPRITVSKQEFRWFRNSLTDDFTIPNTLVGRKSRPNMVETGGTEVGDFTNDYALEDAVPNNDILNADSRYNPLARATTYLTNLIALDREVRTSNLVFNSASYLPAQRVTLSGTSQWSDFTNSRPIGAMLDAMDTMIMRPTHIVMGQRVATRLMQHPSVVQTINNTAQSSGLVGMAALANALEIQGIIVGQGWVNTARRGQAANFVRCWGNHCALLHLGNNIDPTRGSTFGFTAQWGERVAGSQFDGDIGMRGGQRVRVGESVKEVIAENSLGYFFQNAVA